MRFAAGEYSELLGLYLGDGHIADCPRTEHLRIALDTRYRRVVRETSDLLAGCFSANRSGVVLADGGATSIVYVYSRHLSCLFPQRGPGKKHERPILLEPWQDQAVRAAPWSFLRGLVHSDGCFFINRTGRYRYLSVDFRNESSDILDLFEFACEEAGVERRRYERHVRLYQRKAVTEFAAFVGLKR